MEGPDVRWEGVSHRTIMEWVSQGPAAALTATMERRLKSVAQALADTSDVVNTAIQKAGGAWQGDAADAASAAMQVLRGFDDGMHFTSNISGIRAFGQSDSSSFVRANVPPVVDVGPAPEPTGRPIDIIHAIEDYDRSQAIANQAEQRAREVMQQYTTATLERAAALTPLAPPPQVVLDTTTATATPAPPPGPRPAAAPRPDDPEPPTGQPSPPDFSGESPPSAPVTSSRAEASSATSSPVSGTVSAQAATSGSHQPTATPDLSDHTQPGSPRSGAGLSGNTSANPTGRGLRPLVGDGERIGPPSPDRRPTGQPPGAGLNERGTLPARPGTGLPGGPTPVGGVGAGARAGEGDHEKQARYVLPSSEHFATDDGPLPDPYRDGLHVAPPVIGDDTIPTEHPD